MKAQVKCPERLAIYVERAFSKCISDIERSLMREQLEKICEASKLREDFFIKQWEMMPLPCLQRESKLNQKLLLTIGIGNSYAAMNERLICGESNTNMPFPSQQGFDMDSLQSAHPSNAGVNLQPAQKSSQFSFPTSNNTFSISLPGK